jgi:hypothetical protein
MLTIFAMPKAFEGHLAIIQRNAITSWTLLRPRPEVILFGDDAGTSELARDLGIRHIPQVARNEFGTPLINDLFEKAEQQTVDGLLCYVNADIVLVDDFMRAVERVRRSNPRPFMVGRRWNLDLAEHWDFGQPDWQERLRQRVLREGHHAPPEAIDYFLFSRGTGQGLLPLAIGRTKWDNYLLWHAYSRGATIIDASPSVMAVHQSHDYSHHPQGERGVWMGEEARRNRQMIGGWWRYFTIEDASEILTADGLQHSHRHRQMMFRRFLSHPGTWPQLAFLGVSNLVRPLRGERSS